MNTGPPILAVVLVAVMALLIGFHGASMLVTVTQLSASAPKAPAPKSHASLVPQPPAVSVKPSKTTSAPKASEPASEPASKLSEPANQPTPPTASEHTSVQTVTDDQTGAATAAKAKAQAEMDAMDDRSSASAPPEPRRRYRAPRPELHKVY